MEVGWRPYYRCQLFLKKRSSHGGIESESQKKVGRIIDTIISYFDLGFVVLNLSTYAVFLWMIEYRGVVNDS